MTVQLFRFLTLFGLALWIGSAWADQLVRRVVGIADGDTVTVLTAQRQQHRHRRARACRGGGSGRAANTNVIIETLTAHGRRFTMAQRFIPEITEGDKRILLIDGHPLPYALARYPAPGETRGNLAAGGRSAGVALSERDRWICAEARPCGARGSCSWDST